MRVLCLITIVFLVSPSAHAKTIKVPGDAPTIQAGVDAAVDGDVVLLTAALYAGPGNRGIDFGGRAITIESVSQDPTTCVIDCQGMDRGFVFRNGEGADSIVRGVMIRSGTASGAAFPDSNGGGVMCFGASPTLENCIIRNCSGLSGGGVFVFGGTVSLVKCVVSLNESNEGGGLAGLGGSVDAVDCVFAGNVSTADGGGIDVLTGDVALQRCTFAANRALETGEGGAVNLDRGALVTRDSLFVENEGRLGGCVRASEAEIEIASSVFERNRAGAGGVAFTDDDSTLTIRDCSLKENETLNVTGFSCIVSQRTALVIEDSTFAGNESDVLIASLGSHAEIDRCAFIGNEGAGVEIGTASGAIRDCRFEGNGGRALTSGQSETSALRCVFDGNGGGVFTGSDTLFEMASCVIVRNVSDDPGAGVRISGSSVAQISGCLIAQNVATGVNTGGGGAVFMSGSASATFSACTIAENQASYRFGVGGGGGLLLEDESAAQLDNTILWGNSATPSEGVFEDQARGAMLGFSYSVVQALPGSTPGLGNRDGDPQFADAGALNYRLGIGSSAIDAGSDTLLPTDALDVDGDGDDLERLPRDLDAGDRRIDAVSYADSGTALDGQATPDIGAYEAAADIEGPPTCAEDLDGDGDVDAVDIATLLGFWGESEAVADLDGGGVGAGDLAILLSAWGSCS